MTEEQKTKPSFDEWSRWGGVLAKRLSAVVDVYRENGVTGKATDLQIMIVKIRQTTGENAQAALLTPTLRDLYLTQADLTRQDNLRILSLSRLLEEALNQLPAISTDMQAMLASDWRGDFATRQAADLFKGEQGSHNEGIGSGNPQDGQLPWEIDMLLGRETSGGDRPPRMGVTTIAPEDAHRRDDIAQRWGKRNSAYMRSAGRMD